MQGKKNQGKWSLNKGVFESPFMGVTAITNLGGTTSPVHSQLLKLKNKRPKCLPI
ncbi:hypothetical protein I79_017356 [Cricetulus griseus]|uniref:Uncharacterized protein n=1 Tax=Cricetulus griseus TaxID=10029 RepID=G3I1T7_CRIGR|nr:hypothetical protein I79_017356 [Cricetulus griseus]